MRPGFQDVHLEIHSTLDALDLVQAVTEHIARHLGLEEEALHWATMAVRESVMNAITHGNRNNPEKIVSIDFAAAPDTSPAAFIVSVRDQGEGFDPAILKDPLATENLLNASGRGVFLIRQFMDDVVIRPAQGGGTEVRMTKHIRPA